MVVVDPFLAGHNPAAMSGVEDLRADFILQTHGHPDHSMDLMALAKRSGAQVIANFEISNWVNAQGHDNTWAMNLGGSHDFPFGRVTMTPALHSSSLPDGSYGGNPSGYVIVTEGRRIYISGDTAYFSDMELIGNLGIDVAIVCTGDNFTMGPEDALAALRLLRPRIAIPCHYNTWPVIAQDMVAWGELVKDQMGVEVLVLAVDERRSV
jgi:L-ascorbate metabolism protein UlaG (beta-lactamase superfamily)